MPTYGLTTDGLIIKTLTVIREELQQRFQSTFGISVKSASDKAIIGQMVGIVSEIAALVWELSEQINSNQDPDKATGAALDALCTLTGTFRPPATFSVVKLTLTGTDGSVVDEGTLVKTESTNVEFQTSEDATIVALDAWLPNTSYVEGDRVTNNSNAYQCTAAGTSDSSGGPNTDEESITDNGVTWTFLGVGEGAVDVLAEATVTGPVFATARDINLVQTPVSGLESVINLLDAFPGRDVATDEELRQLREAELAGLGNTPIDAIRADLLDVEDVKSVTVFVNNTDTTDADGMPPHSVEAMVRGGDDQDIRDALLANVAAGIQTWGNPSGIVSGTAIDSQGVAHNIEFSRPTEVPIYIIVNVTKDPATYPADGDDLIKEAIVLWGDAQAAGKNAVASAITAQAFSVDGVLDVTSVKLSTTNTPPPSLSVTIPISLRELATYATSRISVVSVDGTP